MRGPRPSANRTPVRPTEKSGRPGSRTRGHDPHPGRADASDGVILYGWHTVKAALGNPARRIRRLYATENAARRLHAEGVAGAVEPELVRPDAIARRLTADAVHNGLLARGRSPALARARRDRSRRHRAGARPDHRPAQCRRHPAHGRGLCRDGGSDHRAPQPGGNRSAGESGLGRAGICADRHRAESRARAR